MDKIELLKQDGIAIGMCQKFCDMWTNPTTDDLFRMYYMGMDFCIEHDWPSVEKLKELYDTSTLKKHGVIVSDGDVVGMHKMAILDNAEVHIHVPAYGMCDIYVRHNSKVHLHLDYSSFCYVSVYDNAKVVVEEKRDHARLGCSLFGGSIGQKDLYDKINRKNNKEE